jgi:hypothetical protein
MIWEICHIKGGGIHPISFTIVCLLWGKTIITQNCSVSWNIIILLTNLQNIIKKCLIIFPLINNGKKIDLKNSLEVLNTALSSLEHFVFLGRN